MQKLSITSNSNHPTSVRTMVNSSPLWEFHSATRVLTSCRMSRPAASARTRRGQRLALSWMRGLLRRLRLRVAARQWRTRVGLALIVGKPERWLLILSWPSNQAEIQENCRSPQELRPALVLPGVYQLRPSAPPRRRPGVERGQSMLHCTLGQRWLSVRAWGQQLPVLARPSSKPMRTSLGPRS